MTTINWTGISGFLVALAGLIAVVVPALLSVATFIRAGNLAKSVDGMKSELVAATRAKALLEGAKIEHTDQKAREAERAIGAASVTPIKTETARQESDNGGNH